MTANNIVTSSMRYKTDFAAIFLERQKVRLYHISVFFQVSSFFHQKQQPISSIIKFSKATAMFGTFTIVMQFLHKAVKDLFIQEIGYRITLQSNLCK